MKEAREETLELFRKELLEQRQPVQRPFVVGPQARNSVVGVEESKGRIVGDEIREV